MASSAEEEVRKRRAKGQTGSPKVYRKLVLLGGVISVLLAIGLSPGMAPMLSAGIIGITLLLFFWLKNHRFKGLPEDETAPAEEARTPEEKIVDLGPMGPGSPEKELTFERETEESEPSAHTPAVFSENRAEVPEEVRAENGSTLQVWVQRIEVRVADVEEKLAKLEVKMAELQAIGTRPDDKVDLQKIFSQMEEKEGKSGRPERSYLVQTEIPTP